MIRLRLPIGQAVDEIVLAIHCLTPDECKDAIMAGLRASCSAYQGLAPLANDPRPCRGVTNSGGNAYHWVRTEVSAIGLQPDGFSLTSG